MNVCEGIFRVSVDIYSYTTVSWSAHKFSYLHRSPNWQWASLDNSVQNHYCIPGKACVVLDKAAAICEIFNVWFANRLIG
jgi:hypothetical protein